MTLVVFVYDNKSGKLVKCFDIGGFAHKTYGLATSDELKQYAEEANKAMANFVPDVIAKQWIGLFNETITDCPQCY